MNEITEIMQLNNDLGLLLANRPKTVLELIEELNGSDCCGAEINDYGRCIDCQEYAK